MQTATQTLEKIREIVGSLASAKIWNDRRIYINPRMDHAANYRGESTWQLYVDLQTGRLINQQGKGIYRDEFSVAVKKITANLQSNGF